MRRETWLAAWHDARGSEGYSEAQVRAEIEQLRREVFALLREMYAHTEVPHVLGT